MDGKDKDSVTEKDLGSMQFDFNASLSENSLGNYLRTVFSNSSGNIPEAIVNQFNNPSQIPRELIGTLPKKTSTPASSVPAIPREFITQVPRIPTGLGSASPSSSASPAASSSISISSSSSSPSPSVSSINDLPSLHTLTEAATASDSQYNPHQTVSAPPAPGAAPVSIQLPIGLGSGVPPSSPHTHTQSAPAQSVNSQQSTTSEQIAANSMSIVASLPDSGQQYIEITEYLNMPQNQAAFKLRVPPSTLSKRWKEAARNRKWPWRTVCKIDKEIVTLLHNIPPGGSIPEEIEANLALLLRRRQEELKPVVIRL